MRKILDVHVHIGEDLYKTYTADEALRKMDLNGIEYAVISPVPTYADPEGLVSTRKQNDLIANELEKHPDRFVRGLAAINPRHGKEASLEVDRAFTELGLTGLMFSSDKTGLTFDNPIVIDSIRRASKYNNPVILAYTSQYSVLQAPFMLEKVARMFPEIPFINGSALKDSTHANCSRFLSSIMDNVYIDIADMNHMLGVLRPAVSEAGLDKILFGSDIPFCDICPEMDEIELCGFSEEEKECIYFSNAAKLFKFSENK